MPAPAVRRPLPVLLLGALALGGCGTETLRSAQLEATIGDQFRAQGIPLVDVSCADGAKAEKGTRISCTGRNASGTTLVIEGRVTAIHGDKAAFRAKAVRGVAPGSVVAAGARRLLEAKVGQRAAGMSCPAKVAIPTTPTVRCVLTTTQGARYAATVRIDARSRLEVELADRPLKDG